MTSFCAHRSRLLQGGAGTRRDPHVLSLRSGPRFSTSGLFAFGLACPRARPDDPDHPTIPTPALTEHWILATPGLRRGQASPRMTPAHSVGGKSTVLTAARIGCSRQGAIRAPEEWPSRRGNAPNRTRLTGRLAICRDGTRCAIRVLHSRRACCQDSGGRETDV
jgi:hypothetical protein